MSVTADPAPGAGSGESQIATARLFTGLDLPAPVAASLEDLLQRLRPAASLRWSPVENLHVTTKFIGNWPIGRLAELSAALRGVASGGAFDVEIRGLGWFPNPHQPHVFWTGVHAGPALATLHSRTDSVAAQLGIPKETKAFSPHLTLARVPPGGKSELAPLRRAVASLESVDFGSFRADRFFLYESKPGPHGSVYVKRAEFPL